MSDYSMTDIERSFVNALAERLDNAEAVLESVADFGDKLDGIAELTKSFDFGSEMAQVKDVLGRVVEFLGLDLGQGEVGAVTAEGGVEKGDQVVSLGEAGDARKKDGMNFAAELMPVPVAKSIASAGGLVGILAKMADQINTLQSQSVGKTSAEVTGEPLAKQANGRRPFEGRF